MPNSLRCEIKKLAVQGIIGEEEKEYLLAKLEGHDKELIKGFAEAIKLNFRPYVVREFSTNYEINSDLVIDDLLKDYGVELDKE